MTLDEVDQIFGTMEMPHHPWDKNTTKKIKDLTFIVENGDGYRIETIEKEGKEVYRNIVEDGLDFYDKNLFQE